jgi:hypothetical protein
MAEMDSENYLLANTLLYAQHACDTLLDMAGIPFLVRKDTLHHSRYTVQEQLAVFTEFYGRIFGQLFLVFELPTFSALTGITLATQDAARQRSQILDNAEYCSEVLNVAAGRTITELQAAFGDLNYLPPTVVRGDIVPPPIRAASVTLESSIGKVHCGFLLNLADVRIGRLLSQAQEKIGDVARTQQALLVLPQSFPLARFEVLQRARQETSGDFYDVHSIKDGSGIGYFVGDIDGDSIGSSLVMAAMKALLRQSCAAGGELIQNLTTINATFCDLFSDTTLSGAYLKIDRAKGCATLAALSHPPILFVPAQGLPRLLTPEGSKLGTRNQAHFNTISDLAISSGDRFVIFTDGLLESARYRASTQKTTMLLELAPLVRTSALDELPRALYSSFFARGEQPNDDLVVMTIEV